MDKKGALRFAILEGAKPLTSIWRVWKWRSDVYVAPRSLAGSFKISLHESGRYRFGFVSDEKAVGYVKPGDDRAVFKWRRPEPIKPGALLMLQIIFPEICLLSAGEASKLPKGLINIERPQPGNATTVSLIWALPGADPNRINFGTYESTLIQKWQLANENRVYITQHQEVIGREFAEQLNAFRMSLPKAMTSIPADKFLNARNLRCFVSLHRDDGVIRFVDVDATRTPVLSTSPSVDQ